MVQLCKLSGAALFNQGKIRDNKLDSGERVIENVSYVTSQAIQGAMVRLGEKTIQEVCINKIANCCLMEQIEGLWIFSGSSKRICASHYTEVHFAR